MGKIGDALANQYARTWRELREAVEHCTDAAWKGGDHPVFIPVRLACHLVETVDYYTQDRPEGFQWGAAWGGADCEKDDLGLLPDRAALLAYADTVRTRVDAWLRGASDDELLGENTFRWTGDTPMERMIYTIRHSQHHIAEINEELTRRGLPPGDWH
ncbi:MAG: hypothetical protein Kow00120_16360 [Anaerolineae bacterium]